MQRDRFLIGILIGIGVLVLVALVLFLSRQGQSAIVQMTLIHGSRDLFDSGYRETNTASLVRQNGAWKIQSIPYPYGSWPIKAEPVYTPLPIRTPIPTRTP